MTTNRRQHTLEVLVENEPGVLARVSGLFSRRAFNIETLNVGPTEDTSVSKMVFVMIMYDMFYCSLFCSKNSG